MMAVRVALWASMALVVGAPSLAAAQGPCLRFGEPRVLSTLQDTEIAESSGLVASPVQAGILFTHNDSGDGPRLFALDRDGAALAQISVDGAEHRDWEGMALGACSEAETCLFIGDVGDNGASRGLVTVYRVPEPMVGASDPTVLAVRLDLTYPDGARDVEAVLVDPLTSDLFLIEKTPDLDARVVVLRDAGVLAASEASLEALDDLAYMGLVTGGTFDPTGQDIVLRGYGGTARRYSARRDAAGRVVRFLPLDMPAVGLFGEAIAYRPDGLALLTTREGQDVPLSETPCMDPDGLEPGAPVLPTLGQTSTPALDDAGCGGSNGTFGPLVVGVVWRRRRGRPS